MTPPVLFQGHEAALRYIAHKKAQRDVILDQAIVACKTLLKRHYEYRWQDWTMYETVHRCIAKIEKLKEEKP